VFPGAGERRGPAGPVQLYCPWGSKSTSYVLCTLCHVGKATCLDQALRTATTVVHQPRQITQIFHNFSGLDCPSATPNIREGPSSDSSIAFLTVTASDGLGSRTATLSSRRYSEDMATTSSEDSDLAVMSTIKSPRVNKEKRHPFVSQL